MLVCRSRGNVSVPYLVFKLAGVNIFCSANKLLTVQSNIVTHWYFYTVARTWHQNPFISRFTQTIPIVPPNLSIYPEVIIGKLCAHKPKCCHKPKCADNKGSPLRVGLCNTWKTSTHIRKTFTRDCLNVCCAFVSLRVRLGEWTHLLWLQLLTPGSKCRDALWPESPISRGFLALHFPNVGG